MLKMKKLLSMALATVMLAGTATTTFAIENENAEKIVNYENSVVTYQEISTITPFSMDDTDKLQPKAPTNVLRYNEQIIDTEANEQFEKAGLLEENGNFDWEALGALPTLDPNGIAPYSVIGSDDRYAVSDLSETPYSYSVYLLMEYNGSYYRGSGFVAGDGMIATCAHNIYRHDGSGWADNVTVILQRDGSSQPYGATTDTRLRTNTGWTQSEKLESDWAIVETKIDLSRYAGSCGIVSESTNITNDSVEIPGYPKVVQDETNSYELWTDMGDVLRQSSVGRVYYDADTSGGNSGSGVFLNGGPYAAAIHAYGSTSGNSGRRINGLLYDIIMEYR